MKSLDELLISREDCDFEAKAAQGRDGGGELPQSLWETYSAMANTLGGIILLGAREEKDRSITCLGLKNIDRIRKDFWNSVNNRQVVSMNLLQDKDVCVGESDGKQMLWIQVPRAERTQRPIYAGANPLTGTYRRNYEGDYRCDVETVRRMLAEAVEDERDSRLLPHFGLQDLETGSLAAYRNELKATKPGHPWLALDDPELLRNLGGWATDRASGQSGLTMAGMLMFGRLPAILEALPNYVVDYQERPTADAEVRWVDRITTDGTWPGNLFEFFRRVYTRLTADLKVPFRLKESVKRIDESHVHEALREALVNTLIHADFSGRVSILVVKRPDLFGFRNPGNLRLPVQVVLQGGTSDCRNRRLQKMFQLIGVGEQAGSGYPKILRAWSEQHWRLPLLTENNQPEQTVLRLPTVSLLPPEAVETLDKQFGSRFRDLGEIERLAVITALVEDKVTNERLQAMTPSHSRDLTEMFRGLVIQGFLAAEGVGRWTSYHLPSRPSAPLDAIGSDAQTSSVRSDMNSVHLDSNERSSDSNSVRLKRLEAIAAPVKQSGKTSRAILEEVLLLLCQDDFLALREVAALVGRSPHTVRVRYLSRMVQAGTLELRYPAAPNHPHQGYRTTGKL